MKKIYLLLAVFALMAGIALGQTPVPEKFVSVNTHMPDSAGPFFRDGRIYKMKTSIVEMGAGFYRVGGNDFDTNVGTAYFQQYAKACKFIKDSLGGIPVVQVPVKVNNFAFTAQNAADLVSYLNVSPNTLGITYFSIGNEWDEYPNNYSSVDSIAIRYRTFVPEMKSVTGQSGITIIGPSLSWFNVDGPNYDRMEQLLGIASNQIISANIAIPIDTNVYPGLAEKYYLDWVSFNTYPYNLHGSAIDLTISAKHDSIRDLIIKEPSEKFAIVLDTMNAMIARSNTAYGRTGNNGLKYAITETNITFSNPPYAGTVDDNNTGKNSIVGLGAAGFTNGQWLAERMAIAMLKGAQALFVWSIHESSGGRGVQDLGLFDQQQPNHIPRSSYYHTEMMANNFTGRIYNNTFSLNGVSLPHNLKAFASVHPDGPGFKVMIMNQNETDVNFTMDFNGGTTSTTSGKVRFGFNFAADTFLNGMITRNYYPYDVFDTVLVIPKRGTLIMTFDCHGQFLFRKEYTEELAKQGLGPKIVQIGNNPIEEDVAICEQHSTVGGTITSDLTILNDTLFVNQNLVLDGNVKLTVSNSVLLFAPNTYIESFEQGRIEIVNSVLLGCDRGTWGGIFMEGNHNANESLFIQNSYFINAHSPVTTTMIANLNILGSTFVNGSTGIQFLQSKAFTFAGNFVGGYTTGLITSETAADFTSVITENKFVEVGKALKFEFDEHTELDITCNEFIYKFEAINTTSTTLKDQGSVAVSAGNKFLMNVPSTPRGYLVHDGPSFTYYYGPAEAIQFADTNVMNVPVVEATDDKLCVLPFMTDCPSTWYGVSTEEFKVEANPDMAIYPNPGSGFFNIKFSNPLKEESTIFVHDIMGRVVATKKLNKNSENATFEIGNNARGLYFVLVEIDGKLLTQKVIVY